MGKGVEKERRRRKNGEEKERKWRGNGWEMHAHPLLCSRFEVICMTV